MHRLIVGIGMALAIATATFAQPFDAIAQPNRAMVYPDNAVEWSYLNSVEITILNNFGPSAEIQASDAGIGNLRAQGVTLHELDGTNTTFLRKSTQNPAAAPPVASHPVVGLFPGESHPLVVATTGVWQAAWTAQLQAQGAQILGAVPPYGALIHLPIANVAAVDALPFVIRSMYLEPTERLAPRLGDSLATNVTTMEVLLYPGFSAARLLAVFASVAIPTQVTTIAQRTLITVDLDISQANLVALFPEVEWIDDFDPGSTYNDRMRVLVQTNGGFPGANQSFYNPIYAMGVDGSTEIISISDGGIRPTHEMMVAPGKVLLNYVPNGSPGTLGDESGHGMAVTCSALGDSVGGTTLGFGTANDFDGLAFGASLIMQDIGLLSEAVALPDDWITEVFQRAYNEGSRIQNSSWGHGNSNDNFDDGTYSFRTQLIDQFMDDPSYYDSVQIFAVGNFGADNNMAAPIATYQPQSLSDEAHSKNAISVGGHRNGLDRNIMYTYSSRGPTNDGPSRGRVKPDLLSVGSTLTTADEWANNAYFTWFGTSHAAPIVAGAVALIRDWFNKALYTGPPIIGEPSSALIKAMLVNSTAFQADVSGFLGNAGAGLPVTGYPNFDQGYGRPVLDAILDPNDYREVQLFQDFTTEVETGDRWSRTVTLDNQWPDADCRSLRVTLAWTDEAMALSAGKALVNDLDLQVSFLGNKFIGNGFHMQDGRFDGVNNVEDVVIPFDQDVYATLPATFPIQVDVLGTTVFSDIPQPFAVVVTFGTCPGTLPCGEAPPCYPGPGDVIPTPFPVPNPCIQNYTGGEYTGGLPWPFCILEPLPAPTKVTTPIGP